ARLWVGSDDGVKVWWNGRQVLQHHLHRPCVADQDWVDVIVRRGWNRLLLKVDQGFGGWAACARLTDLAGKPLDAEWQAARPEKDLVADESDPVMADDWKPRAYKWSEIEDDPWRLLPQWGEAELRRWTHLEGLNILGGEDSLMIDPGEDTPPFDYRRRADPNEAELDNQLSLKREALALVPEHTEIRKGDLRWEPEWDKDSPASGSFGIGRSLYLVRPDAASFVARRFRWREPEWLAWTQFGRRIAFVVRAHAMGGEELSLFQDFREGVTFDLIALPPLLTGGQRGELTLRVTGITEEERKKVEFSVSVSPGMALEEIERNRGGATVARHKLIAPAEVQRTTHALIVATAIVQGVEMRDVDVVELRDAWEVTIETGDGRPLDRAQRGVSHPLVARVRSNLGPTLRGRLAVGAPEGWLPGGAAQHRIALRPRGDAEFKVPIAIPADWQGRAEIRVTATPDDGTPAEFGVKVRTATLAIEALPWCIVGPFSNRDRGGFATAYAPETEDDWSKEFEGATGKVRAFDVAPPGLVALDHVDFLPLFPPGEWLVAYARIHVESPDERPAQLRLGSDDTITAWWNHQQVIAKDVYRPAAPDQEVIPITLRKGDNVLVMKVCQGGGGWEYFCRITDPVGRSMQDLSYRTR
ncbi:MAG: hypothetical protein AAB434_13335, partial [Planctomycetota bacterium]